MSDRARAFAWDCPLPPAERFVLLALADHADHAGGHIDTRLASIAAKTGYAHRTVQRIVRQLVERGVLVLVEATPGAVWMYRIDLAWRAEGVTSCHPCQDVTPDRGSPLTEDHPCQDVTPVRMSPPPVDRAVTPQISRARVPIARPSRARDLTSSSVKGLDQDPTEEEGARAIVAGLVELGLTHPQARQAVRANPGLGSQDIAAWSAWIEAVEDPRPMPIMVSRLKRGEPVPRIRAAPGQGARPGERVYRPMVTAPTETRAEMAARCAARKAAMLQEYGYASG